MEALGLVIRIAYFLDFLTDIEPLFLVSIFLFQRWSELSGWEPRF